MIFSFSLFNDGDLFKFKVNIYPIVRTRLKFDKHVISWVNMYNKHSLLDSDWFYKKNLVDKMLRTVLFKMALLKLDE